jgi:hypothetical protein
MRILYLCPDFKPPSGGIKRLYTHVEILCNNGYDAAIMHFSRPFKPDWFNSVAPIVYSSDHPTLNPEDVMVLPEGLWSVMRQLSGQPVRKVAIALNPFYIFRTMPAGEHWGHYGIEWVMAGNKVIGDFVRWSMNVPNVHILGTFIDHDLFCCGDQSKKMQVAYIERKDTQTPVIEKIIKSHDPSFTDVPFIKIENLPIKDYAQILKQSTIFLSTSLHEGIHRSLLEAMACGCLCAGYHGIGALDYIVGEGERQNFILAEGGNFFDLAHKLTWLITSLRQNDPQINTIRSNALDTAGRYSLSCEQNSVLEFWKAFNELGRSKTGK